ncbi:hypothetical protein JD76_00930 [Micromonospora endolithica]|nr:hypothetical protein JD76_00930 [Micromonospora endolithica]
MTGVGLKNAPELFGIGSRQVDLILDTIESELDGFVGVTAVQVVDKLMNDLLSHGVILPALRSVTRIVTPRTG